MRVFGHAVREERLAIGMTQEELARRIGMTRSSVANLEADRQNISLATACAIADSLGTSVGALLGESPPAPQTGARVPPGLPSALAAVVRNASDQLISDLAGAVWETVRAERGPA